MGRCITIITLTGAASLGLLTGSLTYQSLKGIPDLIRQLNKQVSLKTASAGPILSSIRTNFTVFNVSNLVLASLSTWLFSTAYRHSPASGKHPYLIYSALGAPLALFALYFQTGLKSCSILGPFSDGRLEQFLRVNYMKLSAKVEKKAAEIKGEEEKKDVAPKKAAKNANEDENLDQSYIHISEESSDLSPETPVEVTQSNIEDEVEAALSKKERVQDLETVGSAYNVASVIAGVGFAICSIGVIGDSFFL
ncbi:hypothetical protein OXX69_004645 [Metschnikowia pulcherrima]